jgi:hypothetical protein
VAARLDGPRPRPHPGTSAPAVVVAAVVHGELMALRPFGVADGLVARAAPAGARRPRPGPQGGVGAGGGARRAGEVRHGRLRGRPRQRRGRRVRAGAARLRRRRPGRASRRGCGTARAPSRSARSRGSRCARRSPAPADAAAHTETATRRGRVAVPCTGAGVTRRAVAVAVPPPVSRRRSACLARLVARGCLARVHEPLSGGSDSARWRGSALLLYACSCAPARPDPGQSTYVPDGRRTAHQASPAAPRATAAR